MQGLVLSVKKGPRDEKLTSRPITISVPAGTNRIVNFPAEFMALASGIQIINRDGANPITITINNDVINSFTIPASGSVGLSDQWIEQIQVIAGAAGVTVIQSQVTPLNEVL